MVQILESASKPGRDTLRSREDEGYLQVMQVGKSEDRFQVSMVPPALAWLNK